MKTVTRIGVLLFFLVFVASGERCLNKNDCAKTRPNSERNSIRDIFSERRVERESRVANIRGKVGSERLVNNRRIVDSDSRLSNFPERVVGNTRRDFGNSEITRERNLQNRVNERNAEQREITERKTTEKKIRNTERVRNLITPQTQGRLNYHDANEFQRSERVRDSRLARHRIERADIPLERFRSLEKNNARAVQTRINPERQARTTPQNNQERVRTGLLQNQARRNSGRVKEVRRGQNRANAEQFRNSEKVQNRMTRETNAQTIFERNNRNRDTGRTRNSRIEQNAEHAPQTERLQNSLKTRDLRTTSTRTNERNTRGFEQGAVRTERRSFLTEKDRSHTSTNVRNNQERRESENKEVRDRSESEKPNTRERRDVLPFRKVDVRDTRKQPSRMLEERRGAINDERRSEDYRRTRDSVDENNNKYRSYLNQEYNRLDTTWSKLLTTFAGVLIVAQIVHSNLDSKRFYRVRNLFIATKEKVC